MTSSSSSFSSSSQDLIASFINNARHSQVPPPSSLTPLAQHAEQQYPQQPQQLHTDQQQIIPSLVGMLPPRVVPTTWSNGGLMTTAAIGDILQTRGGRPNRTVKTTYCCKCGSARADVRLPCCGKAVHGRCIYPWPLTFCPTCGKDSGGDLLAIEVMLPEPFRRNGEVVAVAEEEMKKLRGGRWSEAECKFAEMVMCGFASGLLPLRDNARLGTFLCNLLQCTSARLSSKLRTGKRNFKYLGGTGKTIAQPEDVFQHEQQQRQLSQHEELFLHYLSSEEAAVASHSLQLEWRLQFIELAQQLGMPISNLDEWGSLLRPPALSGSGSGGASYNSNSSNASTTDTASELLPSVNPPAALPRRKRASSSVDAEEVVVSQDTKMHMTTLAAQDSSQMRGLASLMVRMAADRRCHFTVQDGVMGATTIEDLLRLLRQGPFAECALLARASNGTILFASAELQRILGRSDTDLLGSLLMDRAGVVGAGVGLVHAQDALFLQVAFRQTQQEVSALVNRMGNPQLPVREQDLMPVPVVLRLRRRDESFSSHQLLAFATEDFLLLIADSAETTTTSGSPPQQQQQQPQHHQRNHLAPALERDFGNMALGHHGPPSLPMQPQQLCTGGFIQPATLQYQHFSDQGMGGAIPMPPPALDQQSMMAASQDGGGGACGGGGGGGDGPLDMEMQVVKTEGGEETSETQTNNFNGDAEQQGGLWVSEEGDDDLEWAADEEMSEVLQTLARASSPPMHDAWGGAYDLYYTPPASFEETMRAFLLSLPARCFQCTDVWVPFQDPDTGRLSLQFGGGLSLSADLSQWIFYSRNFAFYEGQGMPGRIFRSQVPEFVEDVAQLDNTLFLRRDGAEMAGVHASFGVPVVQDQMVFVLVFYSRYNSSRYITQEVLDFIRNSVASWRIQTTFAAPFISSLSSASSTATSSS